MATVVPVTVQNSGGDYTSVSGAISGEARNLVTADEICQIEVDSSGYTSSKLVNSFTISGFTTDSTRYVHLTAQSGHEADGSVFNGALIEATSYSALCTVAQNETVISRLNFQCASTYHNYLIIINYGYTAKIDGCVLKSSGSGIGGPLLFLGSHFSKVYRSLIISDQTSTGIIALEVPSPIHDGEILCCTVHGGLSIDSGSTVTVVRNTVATRLSTDTTWTVSGTVASSNNNAGMDGSTTTPPGTSPLTSDLTDGTDFTDIAGSWDFTIDSGSALYHAGSSNTLSAVPNDIAGNAYDSSTPSIGAFEVAATGETITLPSGTIAIAGQAPQATTTENKFITLPSGTIAIAGQAPTFNDNTNGETINLPSGSIGIAANAPQVTTTENRLVTLPNGTVTAAGSVPQFNDGDVGETINLPSGTIGVAGHAPQVTTTENRWINLPNGVTQIIGQAPQVTTTENRFIQLPSGTVSVAGHAPLINDGGAASETVNLPSGVVSITAKAPTITVTEFDGLRRTYLRVLGMN